LYLYLRSASIYNKTLQTVYVSVSVSMKHIIKLLVLLLLEFKSKTRTHTHTHAYLLTYSGPHGTVIFLSSIVGGDRRLNVATDQCSIF